MKYHHSWALFAVYYFLSCCVSSEAMAQSRKLDYQSAPVAKAAVRTKAVAPVSRVTPNSRAVALPGTTFVPPTIGGTTVTASNQFNSGVATTGNFQYPQIYGPNAYSPAGMGNGQTGIQPTYVQPGFANGMNQPVPDTGMSMMQKLLIFGSIAALAVGVGMKFMGGGSSNSSRQTDREMAEAPQYNTPPEPQEPPAPRGGAENEQDRTPPGPRVAGVTPDPSSTDTTDRTTGPGAAGDQRSPAERVADRTEPVAGPTTGPTVVATSPITSTVPGVPGLVIDHGDNSAILGLAAQPTRRAVAEVPPAEVKTGPVSTPKQDRLDITPTTPGRTLTETPAPRPAPRAAPARRQQATLQPGPWLCASNFEQIRQKPALQNNLRALLNNHRIKDGAVFKWSIPSKTGGQPEKVAISIVGNDIKINAKNTPLGVKQLCSDGITTRVRIDYDNYVMTVVRSAQGFRAVVKNGDAEVFAGPIGTVDAKGTTQMPAVAATAPPETRAGRP